MNPAAAAYGRTVLLRPGELYFGGPGDLIETLLGTCVAITFWHPRYRVGGMCHYVVPAASRNDDLPLGHSAPDAVQALLDHVARVCSRPEEYEVKIFGGGAQFHHTADTHHVGHRNVDAGLALLADHGLIPKVMHVRGIGHRRVILDLDTGHVWLKHGRIKLRAGVGGHAPIEKGRHAHPILEG
jgi:chemotaxis protein CheD